ncbi:MAG TPA: AtpZ/AtpI family protein [Fimbriimonas sp.]
MTNDPRDEGRFPEPPSDEDIAARLRKVREELSSMELPDLPEEELESREREIESRIDRKEELPEVPEWEFKRPKIPGQPSDDGGSHRGMAIGLSAGYTLMGPPIAGWFIGMLIDRSVGGNSYQMYGTLIGAVLGLIGAVFILQRLNDRDLR